MNFSGYVCWCVALMITHTQRRARTLITLRSPNASKERTRSVIQHDQSHAALIVPFQQNHLSVNQTEVKKTN